ncbi:MAG: tyrosine-type recombinase/integrase [Candidatus Sedimenticola sp. (ex Thyasira tokunagai)]
MDDTADGIIAALSAWVADLQQVERRAYLGHETYHKRKTPEGDSRWYYQPHPANHERPRPRSEVTDKRLLVKLEKTKGRGAFSGSTTRTRQYLVCSVLRAALRNWRWIDTDLSQLIDLEKKSKAREILYDYDLLLRLLIHAPIGLDDAILFAAWTGWRRSNIFGRKEGRAGRAIEPLTWARVSFPVYKTNPSTGDRSLIELGLFWYEGDAAKNEESHYHPMDERVEQLLMLRWNERRGSNVFHKGNGSMLHAFDTAWRTTKRKAQAPGGMRWHDLRHFFGGQLAESGATEGEIMDLGNWKSPQSAKIYTKRRREHLLTVLERRGNH